MEERSWLFVSLKLALMAHQIGSWIVGTRFGLARRPPCPLLTLRYPTQRIFLIVLAGACVAVVVLPRTIWHSHAVAPAGIHPLYGLNCHDSDLFAGNQHGRFESRQRAWLLSMASDAVVTVPFKSSSFRRSSQSLTGSAPCLILDKVATNCNVSNKSHGLVIYDKHKLDIPRPTSVRILLDTRGSPA